jgi:hypothetical protein
LLSPSLVFLGVVDTSTAFKRLHKFTCSRVVDPVDSTRTLVRLYLGAFQNFLTAGMQRKR